MPIKACDLSRSSVVSIHGDPHTVSSISVQTPSARGGSSLYKVRFRNARTGQKVDQTFRGEDALEPMDLQKREVQFLYRNMDVFTFMDLEDYDQFDLREEELGESVNYLLEDMEGIIALKCDERVIGIQLPDTVDMEIAETDPSIKGASVTARTKPARLVTGLMVQVPEYIAPGETVRVDTRTGQFLSRS